MQRLHNTTNDTAVSGIKDDEGDDATPASIHAAALVYWKGQLRKSDTNSEWRLINITFDVGYKKRDNGLVVCCIGCI
jgi:hypothetical protein